MAKAQSMNEIRATSQMAIPTDNNDIIRQMVEARGRRV